MGPAPRRSLLAILLCGTALGSPGHAAPAPNAQPAGGRVSAGSATISQSTTATTIIQGSQRAAVDWTSFDVGSNQSVTFQQPSAAAVTLNRVNSPNPSQIAGQINANGQVVLVNQSGVVFSKGAQVNAQSLVVSAAGISNQNFMAGQMVFDQPGSPNAQVRNDGTITVRQAGLAALVAPRVVNNGVITAKMGHVILAGAQTHTLDLYGDGLLSLDITSQVQQAPVGPGGKAAAALVTNNGTIRADGGTILLTASAADGVVQNLVTANGRAYADTIGQQTGTVVVRGTGGSVQVLGDVRAAGRLAGTAGGQVEVNATGAVILAATARVSASGKAGGGTVAVGTTLARAAGGPAVVPAQVAASVSVAAGARIAANATGSGKGGRVTLLSTGQTADAGAITAKGGRKGGDGGTVEVSGGVVVLTGTADVSAPRGKIGTILLDPLDLTISDTPTGDAPITGAPITIQVGRTSADTPGGSTASATPPNVAAGGQPNATTSSTITPATIEGLTGDVVLQATRNVFVNSSVMLTGAAQGLTLEAGNSLTVRAGTTVSAPGGVTLLTGLATIPGSTQTGILTVAGTVRSASNVYFGSGSAGASAQIVISGNVSANTLGLTGGIVAQTGGVITANALDANVATLTLGQANRIGTIRQVEASTGAMITEAPGQAITVTGGIVSPAIALTTDSLTLTPAGTPAPVFAGNFTIAHTSLAMGLAAPGGSVTLDVASPGRAVELTGSLRTPNSLSLTNADLASIQAGTLQVGSAAAGPLTVGADGATVAAATVQSLSLVSGVAVTQTGALAIRSLSVTAPTASLMAAGNRISSLGGIGDGGGSLSITDAIPLMVEGPGLLTNFLSITAPNVVFDDLFAPGSRVTLDIGAGTASGSLTVLGLQLVAQGGSASFVNSVVGNATTTQPAALATISPATNAAYRLDGCIIGVPNCGAVPPVTPTVPIPPTLMLTIPQTTAGLAIASGIGNTVASEINSVSLGAITQSRRSERSLPLINPVRDLSGGPLRDRQNDPDLLLPNVSEKDY